MKKFYLVILTFILTLSFNMTFANTINSINMDIYVDENGNAHVTEILNCFANEDTEWYHTYKNIGESKIINFTVKDEDNIIYENILNWDINASFENKKYKSGINKISDGAELCFGISEYNTTKTYTTTYTITNFVANLEDSQMIYWTLIDFSKEIGNVYIKIHSDFKYLDTYDVWGFGNYGGTAYVYDGYIEMESPGDLSKDEYMTILVKFPPNTFKEVKYKLDNNFEYYLNLAKEGSKEYNDDSGIISLIIVVCIFIYGFICTKRFISSDLIKVSKILNKYDIKEIKEYKEYYRDIPCNKNLFRAYYIAYECGVINKKTDLLGAIILDWLRKKKVSIEKRTVGIIRKREETCIIFQKNLILENNLEQELYNMMYESSKDGILEKKEFEKWCNNKYNKLLNWFSNVIEKEREKLLGEGIIKKQRKYEIINLKAFIEEGKKLKGLKNYLNEYTLIDKREAIEVTLFEEYLIFAQIFGIAKTVIKEFKELYPDLAELSNFETFENIEYVYHSSYKGTSIANKAKSRANSYSSGGGGFSSGGGGGGSFGGGRRRFTLIKILKNII